MEQMQIVVEKVSELARMPEYGSDGAACFDLFAAYLVSGHRSPTGEGYSTLTIGTGLKFDVPDGWVMRVYSRSGQGFGSDVRLANGIGIIDSDYTGEVMVKLTADSVVGYRFLDLLASAINRGDKTAVAQAEICPVEYVTFAFGKVDKVTARGANGFGSTDKKDV